MTLEMRTELAAAEVLAAARRFFTDERGVGAASVVDESEMHVTLATFRNRIAVSAFPAPEGGEGTLVRVSTLRYDEAIGKLLASLRASPVPRAG